MMRAVLYAVAFLIVGVLVTKLTTPSGVGGYEGRERALAEQALDASRIATGNPLLTTAIVARRVVAVEAEAPGECTEPGFEVNGAYPGYRATVRAYTLFRVPIAGIDVTCGGAVWGVTMGLSA
ncbi:hypothetical protein [Rubrivirga litoralis]|uniref:Uncharacterized protein n=1 Tax=Rubrivirga litoralis TaxID=3075598 RepID=A0ABU3BQ45_9BACT|nr:hypothetical protein [Rubrivirga sp. F394]MDT0631412.1 hypothetical protein [Rubrivirga sp. F394]